MQIRIRNALTALPIALLLVLTACGDDGNTVASADDGSADDDDTPASAAPDEDLSEDEFHDQLLEYAQCLRDHGLDVEDPAPGEGIQLQNQGDPAQSDDALQSCESLAPGAPPGERPDEDEERAKMLEYAQCMRDNGVESFEDPEPGEGTHLGPEQAEDPDFEKAEEICNEQIMGGAPDTNTQGQGA